MTICHVTLSLSALVLISFPLNFLYSPFFFLTHHTVHTVWMFVLMFDVRTVTAAPYQHLSSLRCFPCHSPFQRPARHKSTSRRVARLCVLLAPAGVWQKKCARLCSSNVKPSTSVVDDFCHLLRATYFPAGGRAKWGGGRDFSGLYGRLTLFTKHRRPESVSSPIMLFIFCKRFQGLWATDFESKLDVITALDK